MATKAKATDEAAEGDGKKKRVPVVMDRFRAARLCDAILSRLPPEDRALVVEFVRTPRQTMIPGIGNA